MLRSLLIGVAVGGAIIFFCAVGDASSQYSETDPMGYDYKSDYNEMGYLSEATDDESGNYRNLQFGFGLGAGYRWSENPSDHLTVSMQMVYTTDILRFTLRGARFSGDFYSDRYPAITDFGVLIGYTSVPLSLGVSLVRIGEFTERREAGEHPEVREHPAQTTLGLSADLQLIRQKWDRFGYGLYGFGNLNNEAPMAGLTLSLWIGPLEL